ncbi:hypothetical protein CC86DRAFT_465133 [Ophiobolus disseminans]|uniref:F-box domain-containing protein n=1 Tax=Ophiobolus disseminans TaxID=1469910 RepID=A0A6A7AA02_9PLEO|nr:hypothetical protein CC86DRAFT_465133 [Ophiobolus disseminans]
MASEKRKHAIIDDAPSTSNSSDLSKKARLEVPADEGRRTNKSPSLLSLPGELRNQIYHFIVLNFGDRARALELVWDTDERPGFLFQTCRTLRREYRPLYLARKHVVISFNLFEMYLRDFGQDGIGNISVIDGSKGFYRVEVSTNLLPLISSDTASMKISIFPNNDGSTKHGGLIHHTMMNILAPVKATIKDLASAGHLTQVCVAVSKIASPWSYHPVVITFKLSNQYCAQWKPASNESMPEEASKLATVAELVVVGSWFEENVEAEFWCDEWKKPWSVPRIPQEFSWAEHGRMMGH